MRNPFKRFKLPGKQALIHAQAIWAHWSETLSAESTSALRVRWAARKACKRLRAERDELRKELEKRTK